MHSGDINASHFGPDFTWGVATAAYQIEGAFNSDGKGPSIWDKFCARAGKIANGDSGRAACDFYNHYLQDLILMHSMKIPAFRFSLSWSRIFPEGRGRVNKAGVDFYNNLIDFCLELGIEPWITLYHWDLPQALQEQGGWTNREILDWFGDYVRFCVDEFGDRVKRWFVLNEPLVFTSAGHFLGIHAPGLRGLDHFLAAAHHASLCQADGGRIVRGTRSDCKVGTTFSCSPVDPFSEREDDAQAAVKIDALLNRFFVEPLLGMGYPLRELKFLKRIERFMKQGDDARLAFDMDFIGVQNYTREIARYSYTRPLIHAQLVGPDKRGAEATEMNWEVYPESIYRVLKRFSEYAGIRDLIVTENGAAFKDFVEDGRVHDARRVRYLRDYLAQVLRAKEEGVRVSGYFVWTFLDNFEWAEGYRPRFGLVHVDFRTQKRTIKDSGFWYRDFIRGNASPAQTVAAAGANMA